MKTNGSKARHKFSAETKLQILKEGRHTNLSISQVCDEYQISLTLSYQWERIAERAAKTALRGQPRGRKNLRPRQAGEPEIVHDGGPQFTGREWSHFIQATGTTDVRTHPYHSQSNERDERVHRTFREEMPLDETTLLYEARHVIVDYATYYNQRRPHSP